MSERAIPTEPQALRDWRDATLFRLLHRAAAAERAETVARVSAKGHPTLSLGYAALLSNLDTDGTTISDLARRAGVSRQAASQQLATIERDGYIDRRAHPSDPRAVLIRPSRKGKSLLSLALQVVADIEDEYGELLGQRELEHLKSTLTTLLDVVDPAGTLNDV